MENELLLSIAIPTYNRYKYLENCLKATCTIDSDQFEIVVQDNTEDNTDGICIIDSIRDERIKYYHIKEHVTVSENCDVAIENSKGKYVCLLGDDDTVCNNIIDLVREMDQRNIDTCVFGITTYHWPDLLEQMPSLNCFESVEHKGEVIEKDPQKILKKHLNGGFQNISEMPRVYHAIASRKVLNAIKEKTGTFFPGPSPDMANAVGCALLSKSHIQTDVPIMVSGYGGKSTGGMGRKHQHRGSLLDKPWLPKNILEIWDSKIPQLWMGDTIWPASAVTALKALDREDLISKMNYGAIYGELLIHERSLNIATMGFKISVGDFCKLVAHVFKRIIKKIFRVGQKRMIVIQKSPIDLLKAKNMQDLDNKHYNLSKVFNEMRVD